MTARIHAFINGYIRGLVRTSEKRLVDDLRLPVCIWGSLAASLQGHIGRCYLRMVRFIGQKLTATKTGDRDPPMTAIIHAWRLCSRISHPFSSRNCHGFPSDLRHSGFEIYTVVNVLIPR